jgi:hypothetical protein
MLSHVQCPRSYFHCQDRALDSEDVAAFLEHLLREVSGRPELNPGEGAEHDSCKILALLPQGLGFLSKNLFMTDTVTGPCFRPSDDVC